ncbi:PREDICTED: DNA repair protein complementing XP-C cells homolog, partial [Rhagoletis zephyria]|uniref:DNA repair protein complementing XP-C cells homolog n=1 Tax=Rhagoletis zephyria TaxID=28612 RepID=UPI00081172C8
MPPRRSTRVSSKYFPPKDSESEEDDKEESDYDPSDDSDVNEAWSGAKTTRKRKSTDMGGKKANAKKPNPPKKPKPAKKTNPTKSSAKESRKKGKAVPVNEDLELDRNNNKDGSMDDDDSDDDDTADWEEVKDAEVFDIDSYQPELPNNLKITVEKPKKQKNQGDWVERLIRQEINRIRKNVQFSVHKSHLLLLMGRLRYLNSLANDPIIRGLALSIIPKKFKLSKEPVDKSVEKLFNFVNKEFELNINLERETDRFPYLSIISSFTSKTITSQIVFALVMVAVCRILRLPSRLCYFLNPVPVKASNLITKKTKLKKVNTGSASSGTSSVFSVDYDSDNEDRDSSQDWKYNYHWMEVFDKSKKQLEDDWWEKTLKLFQRPKSSMYDDADKKEFDKILSKAPLPKTLSGFKNHPLFVLQRDILKFQAIYPPDAPTLGFFNEMPVFSRDCVHLLKSRETWLRSARTVKVGEDPYKVVDSRFKNDDKRGRKAKLDLFGEWQTQQYEPPVAKDGIVPRNAYGNVELFQECMLPYGTVYLKQQGLPRLAAKLKIDYAPAVTGFDCVKNHRITRPIIEGVVVCEEYKDILLDAWNEKQEIDRQKKAADRKKRIY